jgi:hypothetical protein
MYQAYQHFKRNGKKITYPVSSKFSVKELAFLWGKIKPQLRLEYDFLAAFLRVLLGDLGYPLYGLSDALALG